ncbi:MAG TPA: hypothetical protein VLN44_03900, partial [Pyrinomonadaceae bacterium]|nr:hypothetical protein [Pyrinomonadaceae bacterium]
VPSSHSWVYWRGVEEQSIRATVIRAIHLNRFRLLRRLSTYPYQSLHRLNQFDFDVFGVR